MKIPDNRPVSKDDIYELKEFINQLGVTLMTAISDFAAAQDVFNAAIDASVAAIQADVTALEALIAQLQANPGAISAADQASLDALSAHSQSLQASLAALDVLAKNNPAPPVPAPAA